MSIDQNLSETEQQRLEALGAERLMQLGPNQSLDSLTKLLSRLVGVPTSLVTLLGPERQWIKASHNFILTETPADTAICRRTLERNELTVIEDTALDDEYRDSPLVVAAPHIRFYAGAPLKTPEGKAFGCMCVIGYKPRQLNDVEREILQSVAEIAGTVLEASNNVGFVDSATMLPNRQRLLRDIEVLQARASARSSKPYTLIFLETTKPGYYLELVRGFGVDEVERQALSIANLLRISLPIANALYAVTLSRFAILVPKEDKVATFAIFEKLSDRFTSHNFETTLPVPLSLKLGYYDFDPFEVPAADAFRRSFSALHESLSTHVSPMPYSPEFDQQQRRQLTLSNGLSAALESSDQLHLLYQPKIDLHSRKMVGVEALMRWKHPDYGEVPPMDFIPLISQTTLINPLTCWVAREAAIAIKQFEAAGISTVVSVNVTTTNLVDEAFYDNLLEIMQTQQIDASSLEVECLEMEELLKDPRALNTLTRLRALGVRVALDDFGSGYSNLNYLRRIPADVIKLDRGLISDIAADAGSRAIVFRLIQMLNHFGYEIVAEGVEDQASVDLLRRYNCHIGQGYFFHRPMKLADAIEVGRQRNTV